MFKAIRGWHDPVAVREAGTTPDYRFSLANERTFLAWVRTALALVGGGLATAQFLPPLGVPYLREGIATLLMALGAACGLRAVNHWARCERAMREGRDLPMSRFPAVLATVIALGAVALIVVIGYDIVASNTG